MDLDFSSIHEEKRFKSTKTRLKRPSAIGGPMIPSMVSSSNRNSFEPQIPFVSAHRQPSVNNTRLSNQLIMELDRQGRQMTNNFSVKKPTRYTAKKLEMKKAK